MVLLPRDMRPWLRDMRLCMWLNSMVRVLCPGDMRPRSRDMGPQLRDMITWFRDMRSCMCAVHSWASMRSAAPGLVQRTTWPLTVGRNRLGESKNTKARQARMDEKCASSSHTPSLLLLRLLQWMDFFWDLGFRTWTDKQTDRQTPHLLLYIRCCDQSSVMERDA